MHYVRIADTAELAPGQMKRFQAEGHEVLLANVEGEFYAIADRCTSL
jgi:nitrite reductase/ring-hydroxylating ferredoxin subunit